jgi:outer membrane protein assembly factor BamE (lipoprotein component of BamABCDE complex)
MHKLKNKRKLHKVMAICCLSLTAPILSGCADDLIQHGAIIPEYGLEQIPVGSSREQVVLVLGTPSTTATLDNETYFYISETRKKRGPLNPSIESRRVVAVEFDSMGFVTRVADYGLQDGVVFDFVKRETPTRGKEVTLVRQLLGIAGNFNPIAQ